MLSDLVLFRHAKAVRPDLARDDFDRVLTPAGLAQAEIQALRLFEAGFTPDVALVSTAARAAQTWEAASRYFPSAKVQLTYDLYLAPPTIYLDHAKASQAGRVLLIAHDPGLHELARWFTKEAKGRNVEIDHLRRELPTSAIGWFVSDKTAKNGFSLKRYFEPS
jgi:phosphohistidine phosphatase